VVILIQNYAIFVKMKQAIVSVTNDLTTDQRVDRTCRTLVKAGYEVTLVGRMRTNSKKTNPRSYRMHRMRLVFDKGPLFYAEYNFRLLLFLCLHRKSLLVSNDLDSLPANYIAFLLSLLVSKIIPQPLIHLHDCHEYFRGVPELTGRNRVTAIWKWIEDRIFPKLTRVIAVNNSVAKLYEEEYGNSIQVARNVPYKKPRQGTVAKSTLGIREDQKVILYQGAVNVDRGVEEAILAMKHISSDAIFIVAGIGDIYEKLIQFTHDQQLSAKVRFLGQVPFESLHGYTLLADLGLSIEKDVSVNYHFALPNKFMDYIQANVPLLVSPFPEMKAIVDQYQIGEFIGSHEPGKLAAQFDRMLSHPENLARYKQNLLKAAEELCWENEEQVLLNILNE